MVSIKNSIIDFQKLNGEGMELFFDTDDDNVNVQPDEESEIEAVVAEYCKQMNLEVASSQSEEGEPFDVIASKMFALIPNGKIKKRILLEGAGEKVANLAQVTIDYNAYIQYNAEPFDSTYARKRPLTFKLSYGNVLPGLDIAVQSMKLKEKSQFLIQPEYAYGNLVIGRERIPPNSEVLFEIELRDIVDCGGKEIYEELNQEEQMQFPEIYKFCLAACEMGKYYFKKHKIFEAIKEFNTALSKLEFDVVLLNNDEDLKKHHELVIRLLSNLMICYIKDEKYRECCIAARKIYNLTNNGEMMKIPAKIYFNHGKCLRLMGEYEAAIETLKKALELEPNNNHIGKEMALLKQNMSDYHRKQTFLAKAFLNDDKNY